MNIDLLIQKMNEENHSSDYILLCVNYAKALNEKGLPVIFDVKHYCALMGIKCNTFFSIYATIDNNYREVEIPKKSGGNRTLSMPSENLKTLQRWLLVNILSKVPYSDYATGYTAGKSIVDNAKVHVGKDCIVNVDIKDFFPSIHYGRVYGLFKSLGYTSLLSKMFANITTYNRRLPQGAPTSPCITNLICRKLDLRLACLCLNSNASYTRYVDDITISGDTSMLKLFPVIRKIVGEEGFILNQKKERVLFQHHSQVVTGIVVNNKMRPVNNVIRNLRRDIYYIKKFGLTSHIVRTGNRSSNYVLHLYGLAHYINMVNSDLGQSFYKELNEIDWET